MEKVELKDFVLKQGLILGIIEIIVLLFLYIMGLDWMTSTWAGLTSIVIIIGYVTYSGSQYRKIVGGFIKWFPSALSMFGVYAVAQLVYTMFSILLYHVIDPELPDVMHEAIMETTLESLERWNASEEMIEEQMMRVQGMVDQFGIVKQLLGYGWALLFGVVLAAVIALFIKKKEVDA